jgi:hypothetical protein
MRIACILMVCAGGTGMSELWVQGVGAGKQRKGKGKGKGPPLAADEDEEEDEEDDGSEVQLEGGSDWKAAVAARAAGEHCC